MNINGHKKNRYFKNFIKDKHLIMSITAIILFWTFLYLVIFYKPTYKSTAKVWIRDVNSGNFVLGDEKNNSEKDDPLSPLTIAGNPLLTQIEIIKSREINNCLFNYLRNNYPQKIKNIKNKESFIDRLIKTNNKLGTDIIVITVSWNDPAVAKQLLTLLLEHYQEINLSMDKQFKIKRRKYIDEKIAEIEPKLLALRDKIKNYKQETLGISIDDESRLLVEQKINFINSLEKLNASINNTQGYVSELSKELSLTPHDAINAVALGSYNKNLTDLKTNLNEAMQQYSYDKIKLAPSNPKLIALKDKIKEIEAQIKEQIKITIGNRHSSNNINILDPVREKLVTELTTSQANLIGQRSERKALYDALSRINDAQSSIPAKKFVLDNLEQEERSLSSAYDELKTKQIEAKLKEAEALSNIVIVDKPDLPETKSFPTKTHIILSGLMLSLMLGLAVSVTKTFICDSCEDISSIEGITGKPVIAIIPSINANISIQEQEALKSKAYDNIVSNLLFKIYKTDIKLIAFSSNDIEKYSSNSVYILANELNKLGNSVAVIDADFRNPTFFKNTGIREKLRFNLSDVILYIENQLRQDMGGNLSAVEDLDKDEINYFVNIKMIENPYEFFKGRSFAALINQLRETFDYMLIDTPSILTAPETTIISKLSDGFVLFTGSNVTNSELVKIVQNIKTENIPLIGSIVIEEKPEGLKIYIQRSWGCV